MCPLDIFKHKKNNSNNLLKDCIHHRLPITETKLISQEDTSATATWQATAAGAQACALWSVPSDQQALWIYKAGLEPSSNSVAKHCPPFPTNKCSAAPQPFPQMSLKLLTITLGFGGFFSEFAPRFSKIEFLQTLPYVQRISSSPSAQQERGKPLLQGDSNESRNKLGPGDSLMLEARSAQWHHHKTWHQQPGQGTGCETRNNSVWCFGSGTWVSQQCWRLTLCSAMTWTQTEELGSSRVQNNRNTQKGKDKTVLKKLCKICIFYFHAKHD